MLRGFAGLLILSLIPCAASAQDGDVVPGVLNVDTIQAIQFGQPTRDTPQPTGRSAIRGRIVDPRNGQPVRRALVRVSAPTPQITRTMLTDPDGRYEFRDLPAGRYSINASKTAYVSWSYGQTQPGSPGRPISLPDNQAADNVDIRLPRGAVITGHITDDYGDPAPGVAVTLMRQQFVQGQRRLVMVGSRSTTNDIGEYRLYGIAPGQYVVSVTGAPLIGTVEGAEARNGFAPTYYPGTADEAAAQKLAVGLSQTLSEINIRLLITPLATVSGTAVDAQGRVLTSGAVRLEARGSLAGFGPGSFGPIRRDGTFSIPNVAPGEYVARVNIPRPPPTSAPSAVPGGLPVLLPNFDSSAVAIVTVNGADVTDVLLAPVTPVSVKGRIIADDPVAAQSLNPSSIRMFVQSLNQDVLNLNVSAQPPLDDLTFELKVNPGPISVRTTVGRPPSAPTSGASPATGSAGRQWLVKSIRVNGTDVTDAPIDVGAQGLSGVEIELTNRLNMVSGAVADNRGTAVKDYAVVVFAQDRTRWMSPLNRYTVLARPDDEGRFKVSTLPPGQYYAIALDRVDPNGWQDPDFLDGLSRSATTFSLAADETHTLDLRLFTVQ